MNIDNRFSADRLDWSLNVYDAVVEETGSLNVLEITKEHSFKAERMFWIDSLKPNEVRGKHSHKNLKQILVCLRGSVTFMLDNGKKRDNVVLDARENSYLYLDGRVWREFYTESSDALIMVICDRPYTNDTVIRDYEEFKRISSQ